MRLPLWDAGRSVGFLMPTKQMLAAAISFLLAASLAAPIGARALSDAGFEYTVTGGAATVTGCTSTCPTNLVIPDTLGGYPVTTFSEFAFAFSNLTNVTIPSTVTSITRLAFYSNSLTSVTIPNSVTSIGQGAFYQNNLTTVTIGSSVTSIGESAFNDNLLTTVTIPNSVTSIGLNAFLYNNLTTVTIGNAVTSIGYGAFGGGVASRGNTGNRLTTVTIPDSVTSIGDYAFYTNNLTTVTFLGNAPTAGTEVFGGSGNVGLTSVTRSSTATGWGSTWSGVPVAIADPTPSPTPTPTSSPEPSASPDTGGGVPPSTNRDAAPWLMTLLLLASVTAAAGIQLRQRESRRK